MAEPSSSWQQALQAAAQAPAAPWGQGVRQQAARQFAALHWPTARQEAWKYTNVTPLVQTPFVLEPAVVDGSRAPHAVTPAWAGAQRVVFVNGHFAAHLSTLPTQAGVTVQALSAALQDPGSPVQQHLGQSKGAQTQTFVALGQALLQDGVFIHVAAGKALDTPLELLFLSTETGAAWMAHPHVVVVAERGSHLCLIERHEAWSDSRDTWLTNVVSEVFVHPQANVQHHLLQAQSRNAYHLNSLVAQVGQGGEFSSFGLQLGASLSRQSLQVHLQGQHARCSLGGLQLGRDRQHHDVQILVEHAGQHTESSQLYKGIFNDQAMGVFSGKVRVQPGAIKTNAKQLNKNLLLSRQAVAHTLPQLEILTDDVKCSHGATVGQLNEDQRFYLRSRGLDAPTTQRLLTYAFASDVVASMPHAQVRSAMDAQLRTWLQLHDLALVESGGAP